MEFSCPWKEALHEVKHGFMALEKKNCENRTKKQRNALRQSEFVNQ